MCAHVRTCVVLRACVCARAGVYLCECVHVQTQAWVVCRLAWNAIDHRVERIITSRFVRSKASLACVCE